MYRPNLSIKGDELIPWHEIRNPTQSNSKVVFFRQISVPEVSRIDTGAIYNKMSIRELQSNITAINWLEYFTTLFQPMDMTEEEEIVSYSTAFFIRLGEIIKDTDKRLLYRDPFCSTIYYLVALDGLDQHY